MKIYRKHLQYLIKEVLQEESQAATQAKQMGLTHRGFGQYADKTGKVTYKSRGGKLVPVGKSGAGTTPTASKSVNQKDSNKPVMHKSGKINWKSTVQNAAKAGWDQDKILDKLSQDMPRSRAMDIVDAYYEEPSKAMTSKSAGYGAKQGAPKKSKGTIAVEKFQGDPKDHYKVANHVLKNWKNLTGKNWDPNSEDDFPEPVKDFVNGMAKKAGQDPEGYFSKWRAAVDAIDMGWRPVKPKSKIQTWGGR
jgi:hypothetical protein